METIAGLKPVQRYCWPDNPRRCEVEPVWQVWFKSPSGLRAGYAVCSNHLYAYIISQLDARFILTNLHCGRAASVIASYDLGSNTDREKALFIVRQALGKHDKPNNVVSGQQDAPSEPSNSRTERCKE